jgi:hypothetical protein
MCAAEQRRVAPAFRMRIAEPCFARCLASANKEYKMSIGTILLIVLVLALVGVIPAWGHSSSWGYGPSGGIGLVVLVLLILVLMGKI